MFNRGCSPRIENCTFSDNNARSGGAILNEQASAMYIRCIIENNTATEVGGGMTINDNSSPTIENCIFRGNSAQDDGGGIINLTASSPTITNCVFSGNSATNGGGIFNVLNSSPQVTNCSFSGNKATNSGGAMQNNNMSNPVIKNCILWGNSSEIENGGSSPTVTYSIVQGGQTGTGNLDCDPLFVNQPAHASAPTTVGDLHIGNCSPAKDMGVATGAPTEDFDGDMRPQGSGYDMGFDENTSAVMRRPLFHSP